MLVLSWHTDLTIFDWDFGMWSPPATTPLPLPLPLPFLSVHSPQLTFTVVHQHSVFPHHGISKFQNQVGEVVLLFVFGLQRVSPTRSGTENGGRWRYTVSSSHTASRIVSSHPRAFCVFVGGTV